MLAAADRFVIGVLASLPNMDPLGVSELSVTDAATFCPATPAFPFFSRRANFDFDTFGGILNNY